MRHIDASSIIHAWDEYPLEMFPKLWQWLSEEFTSGNLMICATAMKEVKHNAVECHQWIIDLGIDIVQVGNAATRRAGVLKTSLGIANDKYHPDGVDENDIIIACAFADGVELIANEAVQPIEPLNLKKYKIPATCRRNGQSCINFRDYMKTAGRIF